MLAMPQETHPTPGHVVDETSYASTTPESMLNVCHTKRHHVMKLTEGDQLSWDLPESA